MIKFKDFWAERVRKQSQKPIKNHHFFKNIDFITLFYKIYKKMSEFSRKFSKRRVTFLQNLQKNERVLKPVTDGKNEIKESIITSYSESYDNIVHSDICTCTPC